MKALFLFSLVSPDLIGYNRQRGMADKLRNAAPLPNHTQDQIIIHLAKNGEFKQLREFLATIRRINLANSKTYN